MHSLNCLTHLLGSYSRTSVSDQSVGERLSRVQSHILLFTVTYCVGELTNLLAHARFDLLLPCIKQSDWSVMSY